MYNNREIMETIRMIEEQNLDVRTITMGISLIDCMDTDIDKSCEKVYNKIYKYAKDLVKTKTNPDEDEFLEIYKIPISELKHKIETFEICDAKTVIAILMSEKYLYREE